MISRCLEMQSRGCSLKEITDTYHSGYLRGMLEGDTGVGTLMCGAACALVTHTQSASSVVQELVEQADKVVKRLAAAQ